MSNANNGNTKPIKSLPVEDTQPNHVDESWLEPVDDEDATVPVKRTLDQKPQLSTPAPDADATNPVAAPRRPKTKPAAPQTQADESATVPVRARSNVELQPETPLPLPAQSQPISAVDRDSVVDKLEVIPPAITDSNAEIPGEVEPPAGKVKRRKWIWLGILGMLVIMLFGAGIGYASAIRARMIEQQNQRLITATTQFELGLVDQREGRLETAQQRFEYVLSIYPEFPGITDKLVEVGLALAATQGGPVVAPTQDSGQPETVITPVPTKDTASVSVLFNQAQNQLKAKDWEGLYTTLDKMRFIDPEYESVKADGMLYMALRNRGIIQIQTGHLEPGLYSFALASQIAPIDTDAEGYYTWASRYLKAASYGLVDEFLDDAVAQFSELYALVPNLRDASGITVSQRYAQSLVYLGDYYQRNSDYCGAVPIYQQAAGIYALTSLAEKIPQAEEYCKNPPVIEIPTAEATPQPAAATPQPTIANPPPAVVQPTDSVPIAPLPTDSLPTAEPTVTISPTT